MGREKVLKDLESWVSKVKGKGSVALELARLRLSKASLERKASRIHTRLGERVEYLLDLGREPLEEDEVMKGFMQELQDLRKEIKEAQEKMDALKIAFPEGKGEGEEVQGG